MAKTAQNKSSPQNWRARGLIISRLTGKEILNFDRWVFVDVDYRFIKYLLFVYKLVNLFTAKNRLELGPYLLRVLKSASKNPT